MTVEMVLALVVAFITGLPLVLLIAAAIGANDDRR